MTEILLASRRLFPQAAIQRIVKTAVPQECTYYTQRLKQGSILQGVPGRVDGQWSLVDGTVPAMDH